MRDDHIAFLMEDSHRDLFYAQQFLGEGVYASGGAGWGREEGGCWLVR